MVGGQGLIFTSHPFFLELSLMVADLKPKVLSIARACIEPKWGVRFEVVVDEGELGIGFYMGDRPWNLIGSSPVEFQPLLFWTSGTPLEVHFPIAQWG